MQVEGHREGSLLPLPATGARVSNAYRTCPIPGDSLAKVRLIPDGFLLSPDRGNKEFRYGMAMRPISWLAG